jgi:hypothetical protein
MRPSSRPSSRNMIAVITGVVTVGGVDYPVQTQIDLPDTRSGDAEHTAQNPGPNQ